MGQFVPKGRESRRHRKPQWTEEHDKIIAEYKRRKTLGLEKEFVIVPRDVEQ